MAKTEYQNEALMSLDLCKGAMDIRLKRLINAEMDAKMWILFDLPLERIAEIRERASLMEEAYKRSGRTGVLDRGALLKGLPDQLGYVAFDGARHPVTIDWTREYEIISLYLEADLKLSKGDVRQIVFDAVRANERMKIVVQEAVADAEAALAGARALSRNQGAGSANTGAEAASSGAVEEDGVEIAPPGSKRKIMGSGGIEI